jgi:hypothetical protein
MSAIDIDEIGPIDYLVVEFPGSKFNGEIAPELVSLVDRGIIKVLDLLLVTKDADGSVEGIEIADLDNDAGELLALDEHVTHLISEADVESLAAAIEPGTTAGVLVSENHWAAPFASACRRAGGQLVAGGRIPVQAVIAALEAEEGD